MLHGTGARGSPGGRWVATGGGGYQWARVVPRAWTLYFAEMADAADDLPDALPESWIEGAERLAQASRCRRRSRSRRSTPDRADKDARAVVARLADILWA